MLDFSLKKMGLEKKLSLFGHFRQIKKTGVVHCLGFSPFQEFWASPASSLQIKSSIIFSTDTDKRGVIPNQGLLPPLLSLPNERAIK
jgi:hypothetical protein